MILLFEYKSLIISEVLLKLIFLKQYSSLNSFKIFSYWKLCFKLKYGNNETGEKHFS